MVLDSNSSISIDSDISLHRVLKYYRTVKLNGYYYGVMKTALAKQIRLQEQLGFDCLFIASVMFTGKVKVVDSVASHKTIGGMSHDSDALVSNMGNRRFFTKYLVGLTVAANAARDVFQSPVYGMKGWRRFVHPVRIGLAAYSNTFRWDVALNARRVSRRLARLIEGQSS
jgi:hypothetical protein